MHYTPVDEQNIVVLFEDFSLCCQLFF